MTAAHILIGLFAAAAIACGSVLAIALCSIDKPGDEE